MAKVHFYEDEWFSWFARAAGDSDNLDTVKEVPDELWARYEVAKNEYDNARAALSDHFSKEEWDEIFEYD